MLTLFNHFSTRWLWNFFPQSIDNLFDILIYSTDNEGKSVAAERFVKPLNGKIYINMTANDNKSYLGYLKKLVDGYNNTYH